MAKSLCRLLMYMLVNHVLVAIFSVNSKSMSFNANRKNKILAKNSEFTVSRSHSTAKTNGGH